MKAVVLGAIFGVIFGAVTVYLALRAGLTVSASIPIAVLAIAVFKRFSRSTILENNIVQTIGSAGESIAAGVVFTIPAFLFIASGGAQEYFNIVQIVTLAAVGGIIGVLMMVPMRRALIVKEHGILPYPEGTACAEVLIAGERGGELAKTVFAGFWTALFYSFANKLLALWREVPRVLVTGPDQRLPERDADQRDHAGVPGRRLHHRAPHLRHHGLRQRPVVARADPPALDAGAGGDGPGRPAQAWLHP